MHEALVLPEFERRLEAEYLALCGATPLQLGVKLKPVGQQQDVIVEPHIGNTDVVRVLSEGEQKVHALAVFLCEAATDPSRVLVLDDPVTSFDYNIVSNVARRIRDLSRSNPDTQIVVLTHNWDFFAGLQTVLSQSGMEPRLHVAVLENCEIAREYVEKYDSLCAEIAPLVAGPAEPSAEVKSRVAGLMRRLIEVVVNTCAFNGQRHQFKQKSLRVTDFQSFTKLVALLPAEADKLRDLYADLSPQEHDDPRNFYTSRSLHQFQTWFSEITAIKNALTARKPP